MTKNVFQLAEEKGLCVSYSLSGHTYRNSSFETSNSCGNCDGDDCERCSDMWTVYKDEEIIEFCYDKDELHELIMGL